MLAYYFSDILCDYVKHFEAWALTPCPFLLRLRAALEPGWASTRVAHRMEVVDHCSPFGRVVDGGLWASNLIFHLEGGG